MLKKENHAKIIFHIDMNAFFCSVACILNPSLRGKVFAIGRENTYKGVISTASYEARKLGIHSAMPLSEAYHIKPDLLVVNIDYRHYRDYHNKFINIIKQYTDLIEVASIDEVYADMTEASKKIHPIVLAKEIQRRLLAELDLPCSIGIAPTLFLAKMASDMKKPLGLTVIRKREVSSILYSLSVKEIFGIGKKTYPILINNGINTIGDFMNEDNMDKIINLIGVNSYEYVVNSVLGKTSDKVMPDRYSDSNSISTSATFDVFLSSMAEILYELRRMTREIWSKMNRANYYTKTITITLRDSDFVTITRQTSLDEYTNDFNVIFETVEELLEENIEDKLYRLVGVGVSSLLTKEEIPVEYNLFTVMSKEEKELKVEEMISDLQNKYGKNVIFRKKR